MSIENWKKLDQLNLYLGSLQSFSPTSSRLPVSPVPLNMTQLSLSYVELPHPHSFDPASIPFVRSLHLSYQSTRYLGPLLTQIHSLFVHDIPYALYLTSVLLPSTSITSLSLQESDFAQLDARSGETIKGSIVEWRIVASGDGDSGIPKLVEIIAASKVLKKIILDGSTLTMVEEGKRRMVKTVRALKKACKQKKIELWKENFYVDNGKVDLK